MKKIFLTISLIVALFCAPTVSVSARVGGAIGGGGGMHMGGHPSYGGGHMMSGRRMLLGRGLWFGGPIIVLALAVGGWQLLKRRQQDRAATRTEALSPIDPALAKDFEPLFYTIEEAWSQNDQATLAQHMTSKCFRRQKAILDRWQQAGRLNRLEDLVLIDMQQELSDADHPHVVITAQARDYFEYLDRPAAFNQTQHDEAMIERFSEVWELAYAQADGRLLLAKIRQ